MAPMYGAIGISAPMIIKEIEEVGNRASLVPKETEIGCQFIFDILASDQHAY